jgi:hypothetical protein
LRNWVQPLALQTKQKNPPHNLIKVTKSISNASKTLSQWHMPIILATQKAEIRKIEVLSHPGQIV